MTNLDRTESNGDDSIARALLEQVLEPLLAWDAHCRIVHWGRGCERLYGIAHAHALGRPRAGLLGSLPADAAAETAGHSGYWRGEMGIVGKDGKTHVVDCVIRRNSADLFVEAHRDITRIRQLEQALAASQPVANGKVDGVVATHLLRSRQLEAMHDASVNAIITIDPRGIVQSINAATTRMFGYGADELVGRNVKAIMPAPLAADHDGFIANYLTTGQRRIIGIGREVTAQRKDGSTFPVHLAVGEFEAEGSRYFTGMITDLTGRQAAEEALRETERQLAQAQKMEAVGQLTGGLAHDFNNLLTVISGNLELLEMRLEDDLDRDLLKRADEAARMGARLISRLLVFSRRRALKPTTVQLNDTTIGMTELLRRSLGESISVTTDLASDLWNVRVDANEIENAILNLAINARDAMPNGGRILLETGNVALTSDDLAHSPDAKPGEYVKLTVSDNGSGMPPEIVARAFEPFFTTKAAGRGTGLGLSTLYGLVKQSGGHANIYSEIGKGTSVSIYLPREKGGDVPATDLQSRQPVERALGERVLVVEDNEEVRQLTVRHLEALGYRVWIAEDGVQALAILGAKEPVDLVLSDVVMPGGVSGFDVARWVRDNRPDVRILLTSGFAPELANGGQPVDADLKLLRKPYRQADLARAVRDALT